VNYDLMTGKDMKKVKIKVLITWQIKKPEEYYSRLFYLSIKNVIQNGRNLIF